MKSNTIKTVIAFFLSALFIAAATTSVVRCSNRAAKVVHHATVEDAPKDSKTEEFEADLSALDNIPVTQMSENIGE